MDYRALLFYFTWLQMALQSDCTKYAPPAVNSNSDSTSILTNWGITGFYSFCRLDSHLPSSFHLSSGNMHHDTRQAGIVLRLRFRTMPQFKMFHCLPHHGFWNKMKILVCFVYLFSETRSHPLCSPGWLWTCNHSLSLCAAPCTETLLFLTLCVSVTRVRLDLSVMVHARNPSTLGEMSQEVGKLKSSLSILAT